MKQELKVTLVSLVMTTLVASCGPALNQTRQAGASATMSTAPLAGKTIDLKGHAASALINTARRLQDNPLSATFTINGTFTCRKLPAPRTRPAGRAPSTCTLKSGARTAEVGLVPVVPPGTTPRPQMVSGAKLLIEAIEKGGVAARNAYKGTFAVSQISGTQASRSSARITVE